MTDREEFVFVCSFMCTRLLVARHRRAVKLERDVGNSFALQYSLQIYLYPALIRGWLLFLLIYDLCDVYSRVATIRSAVSIRGNTVY